MQSFTQSTVSISQELKKLVSVLLNPASGFNSTKQSKSLLMPVLYIAIVAFFMAYMQTSKINWESAAIQQYYANSEYSEPLFEINTLDLVSAADRTDIQALQKNMEAQGFWSPALSALIMPVQIIVLAGGFYVLFLVIGVKVNFQRLTRCLLITYTWPLLSISLFFILSTYGDDSLTISEMKTPSITSISYYLPDLSPLWKSTLSSIDLVNLWIAVLMFYCFHHSLAISKKVSLSVVAYSWVAYIAVKHLIFLSVVADCVSCSIQ